SIAQISASLKPRAAAAARGFRLAVIWAMLQRSRGSRSQRSQAIACQSASVCSRISGRSYQGRLAIMRLAKVLDFHKVHRPLVDRAADMPDGVPSFTTDA